MGSPTPLRPRTPHSWRWIATINATVVHLAASTARGLPLLDNRWGEALIEPAREVRRAVHAIAAPDNEIWSELGGLAAEHEDPYELAQQTCQRVGAQGNAAATLGESLLQLKQIVRAGHADLLDELAARARPIREQWESRGPGLLARLAELCLGWSAPETTDIVLVYPLLGGGGWASIPCRRLLLEGVLVDPLPWLPEAVRLGWLVGQIGAAEMIEATAIPPGRFPLVAQLALVPPILAAAQHVEWARDVFPARVPDTLAAWHVPSLPERPVAELLEHWWQGVRQQRPPWPRALERLDQLL